MQNVSPLKFCPLSPLKTSQLSATAEGWGLCLFELTPLSASNEGRLYYVLLVVDMIPQ